MENFGKMPERAAGTGGIPEQAGPARPKREADVLLETADAVIASGDAEALRRLERGLVKAYDVLAVDVALEGAAESEAWKKALETGQQPPMTEAGAKLNDVARRLQEARLALKPSGREGAGAAAQPPLYVFEPPAPALRIERHSVDRVVGGTPREQEEVQARLEERFRSQKFRDFEGLERPKTPEDLQMIEVVNRETDRLRKKYGLPEYRIPTENIHILDAETAKVAPELRGGGFALHLQGMYVIDKGSRLHLLSKLFHEAVHFKSFGSVNVEDGGKRPRRSGLSAAIEGDEDQAFERLNEAVTEELAKRLTRANRDDATVADEAAILRRGLAGMSPEQQEEITYIEIGERLEGDRVEVKRFGAAYPQERQALKMLISKLQERNPQRFRDKDEWLDLFASAMFTGHLLELARTIENTFGQGAFRKLGEQKTGEDFLKFVESL